MKSKFNPFRPIITVPSIFQFYNQLLNSPSNFLNVILVSGKSCCQDYVFSKDVHGLLARIKMRRFLLIQFDFEQKQVTLVPLYLLWCFDQEWSLPAQPIVQKYTKFSTDNLKVFINSNSKWQKSGAWIFAIKQMANWKKWNVKLRNFCFSLTC